MAAACELCEALLDGNDEANVCPGCVEQAKALMQSGKANFQRFVKACAELEKSAKALDARVEELNGLVAGLYEIGNAILEGLGEAMKAPQKVNWLGLAGKALDALGKFKGGG